MDPELLKTCFILGVMSAEHVHGFERPGPDDPTINAIFDTVKAVAEGDLTLLNTIEEMMPKLPPAPPEIAPHVAARFREMLRIGRENQRIVAQKLMVILPK